MNGSGKIDLLSTSIMITEFCDLKCKLCLAYIPYYKEHKHMEIGDIKKALKKYFEIVNTVDKMSITGGEPLLHPDFCAVLYEILKYKDRINKEIIVITNGTIKFTDQIIECLSKDAKIKVIVNNYEDYSVYAKENYEELLKYNINSILYTEDNRYGWIDCRDHSLKHNDLEEREKQALHCAFFQGKKYVIKRGKLHTCTRSAYRIQENIIPYAHSDYIDLLDDSQSVEESQIILNNLLKASSTKSCAYCDGLTEQSIKYKAAEQLER